MADKGNNNHIIDWGACLKSYDNNSELLFDIFSMLTDDLKEGRQIISKCLANKDREGLLFHAERIFGSIVYFTLPELEPRFRAFLEAALDKSVTMDELDELYKDVDVAMSNCLDVYQDMFGE